MERDIFPIKKDFYDTIKKLPLEEARVLCFELLRYVFDGEESENLNPTCEVIFTFLKPQINAACDKYEKEERIRAINTENGRKGGAPKGNHNSPNGRRGNGASTDEKAEINRHSTENQPTRRGPLTSVNNCVSECLEEKIEKGSEEISQLEQSETRNLIKSVKSCISGVDASIHANLKNTNYEDTKTNKKNEKKLKCGILEQNEAIMTVIEQRQDVENEYVRFMKWLKANAKYCVAHMKLPTEVEYFRLIKEKKYTSREIAQVVSDIENRNDLRKRYNNLYQTMLNWLKRLRNGGQNTAR